MKSCYIEEIVKCLGIVPGELGPVCQKPREVEACCLVTVVTSKGDGLSIMTSNLSGDLVAYSGYGIKTFSWVSESWSG